MKSAALSLWGLTFSVIRSLGNKQEARNTMEAAGVPVIPGTKGAVLDIDAGKKEADRIGYPVIIKAALGGGGKGMRPGLFTGRVLKKLS